MSRGPPLSACWIECRESYTSIFIYGIARSTTPLCNFISETYIMAPLRQGLRQRLTALPISRWLPKRIYLPILGLSKLQNTRLDRYTPSWNDSNQGKYLRWLVKVGGIDSSLSQFEITRASWGGDSPFFGSRNCFNFSINNSFTVIETFRCQSAVKN